MRKNIRKYIYSNKKHTEKGIFSAILACLSFSFMLFMIILSYVKKGNVGGSFGAAAFVCTIFSCVGLILGMLGKAEPDKFYLFAYIGIAGNALSLILISSVLYAGL